MAYNKASYERHKEKRLADAKERRKTHPGERAAYRKAYNAAHREENNARQRRNKEQHAKHTNAYRKAHPEKVRQWAQTYYESHRDEIAAKQKEIYRAQREKRLAYHKAYRAANREKIAAQQRAYQQANRDKFRVSAANRLARKVENGGSHSMDEWHALCAWFGHACVCCGATTKLVVDHVLPVSKGGSDDIANLQPLCKPCNSKKHVQIIDYRDPILLAAFLDRA